MTQRTKADLLTLFATNGTGAITAVMLRDFVESAVPSSAALTLAETTTTIDAPSAFKKAANASALVGDQVRFSSPADNRLRYDGTEASLCDVEATITFSAADMDQDISFAFAVNGVVVNDSAVTRTYHDNGLPDTDAIAVALRRTLQPTDYVELWVKNDTSTASVTVRGTVRALGFLT